MVGAGLLSERVTVWLGFPLPVAVVGVERQGSTLGVWHGLKVSPTVATREDAGLAKRQRNALGEY